MIDVGSTVFGRIWRAMSPGLARFAATPVRFVARGRPRRTGRLAPVRFAVRGAGRATLAAGADAGVLAGAPNSI